MTHNHEYNIPERGSTDWAEDINGNFDQLDAEVELRGPDERRSEYEPKPGAKYLATDTESVYIGDGQSWNELASRGRSVEFDSVEATDVNSTLVANDGQQLQAHIDRLEGSDVTDAPGGGLIRLKRRVYRPEEPVVLKRGVVLRGQLGMLPRGSGDTREASTVISGENIPEGEPIVRTRERPHVDHGHGARVENLVVDGAGRFVHGIKLANTGTTSVSSTVVQNLTGHGIWMRGLFSGHVDCVQVNQTSSQRRGTYGVFVEPDGELGRKTQVKGNLFAAASGSDRNTQIYTAPGSGGGLRLNGGNSWRTGCKLDNTSGVAVVKDDNGSLQLSHAIITGEGDDLVGIESRNTDLNSVVVEKFETGIEAKTNRRNTWRNIIVQKNNEHGIKVTGDAAGVPVVEDGSVRDNGAHGIVIEAPSRHPIGPIRGTNFRNNSGWAIIDKRGSRRQGGSVKSLYSAKFANNSKGAIANPDTWDRIDTPWFTNHNQGVAELSSDDEIRHGMDEKPEVVFVQANGTDRASVENSDEETISVVVRTTEGDPIDGRTSVNWRAFGASYSQTS